MSETRHTLILSSAEMAAREGGLLQKSMNFRDDGRLSVFLVLPRDGEYRDDWIEESGIYVFEGHDSETLTKKSEDQLSIYESGKLSGNGRFFKAARAFKDGGRSDALQIQVYEKLDAGVWFDKGIFNLVDAQEVNNKNRVAFHFLLSPPAGVAHALSHDPHWNERMISATNKKSAWDKAHGRCAQCGSENALRFEDAGNESESEYVGGRLLCMTHGSSSASRSLLF